MSLLLVSKYIYIILALCFFKYNPSFVRRNTTIKAQEYKLVNLACTFIKKIVSNFYGFMLLARWFKVVKFVNSKAASQLSGYLFFMMTTSYIKRYLVKFLFGKDSRDFYFYFIISNIFNTNLNYYLKKIMETPSLIY